MSRLLRFVVAFSAVYAFAGFSLQASVTVNLTSNLASPQLIGTPIKFSATGTDTAPGPLSYRFQVTGPNNTTFRLLRDFGTLQTFSWVPTLTEGTYQIKVTARDYSTGEGARATVSMTINTRIVSGLPSVVPTTHPMVALFSAPHCASGSSVRVRFQSADGSSGVFYTDFHRCTGYSSNFLVGGMRPSTTYQMNYEIQTGVNIHDDPNVLSFETASIPPDVLSSLPSTGVLSGPNADASSEPILLAAGGGSTYSVATDLHANIIWYYKSAMLTRPVQGGTMMVLSNGTGTGTGIWGNGTLKQELLREVDLAGNVIRETSADRISEQLPISDLPNGIDRFTHEARKLPNGNYLVLGEAQQIFPAGTQGSPDPIDILGSVIMILDQNFQLLWYWNSFDHASGNGELDLNRVSTETGGCAVAVDGSTGNGCPSVLLLPTAADWLHTNALQLTPDGDIIFSMRNQDWIAKIDYDNGFGSDRIVWRMGVDGDFAFVGTNDPYPWFSGQHESAFEFGGMQIMSVYDDGNTRVGLNGGNSRGQVLSVDELNRTVSFVLNADLGVFTPAVGSAQPLLNGNWFFDCGQLSLSTTQSKHIEVTGQGSFAFKEQIQANIYRSWRMTDLYSAPTT